MDQLATSFSGPVASRVGTYENLRAQAEELESVFLNTLMSQMFSGLDEQSDVGGGYAQQTWRGMQSEQFAATLARNGGIGIADNIMSSLLAAQEAAQTLTQPA